MIGSASSGYLAAIFATIIWAGNFIVARMFALAIPPCQFNFWRWVIAFIVICPFAVRHLKTDLLTGRRNFAYFSLMGILGVALMNVFVYKAGQTTTSLNMALITPATPAIILLLARIFYKEKITSLQLTGLGACILGVLTVISKGSWGKLSALDFNQGDLWTLGCVFCFALYSLLLRRKPQGISSTGFNAIVFGLGIIYALPSVIIEYSLLPAPVPAWDLFLGLCYAGIGCSAMAFWLWTVGIERIGPVKAGFIYYSLPVFAAIMAWAILDEIIIPAQIFGGILIIGGISLANLVAQRK